MKCDGCGELAEYCTCVEARPVKPAAEARKKLAAQEVAKRFVEKLFAERKGHGGGPVGYMNFTRENLATVLEAVYEVGFTHGAELKRRSG